MPASLSSRLLATVARRMHRLRADESGNVLVYVTLTATLLLGIVGLALDSSRAMITDSEAQAAADAAALAGASQLDGQSDACDRAKSQAATVANRQRFAEGGGADISIAAGSPVCLSDLPDTDGASTAGLVTTNGPDARYVQVTTQQLTHKNTLLSALTTQDTALIQRTGIAGFRRSLCAGGPVVMVCDSVAWGTGVAYDAWLNIADVKGWLAVCGNSAPCVEDTLASVQPKFCVKDDTIDPVPGHKTAKAADGYNTRFGQGSTSDWPSDLNITTYPHDNVAGQRGWDCAAYWSANHASDGFPQPAGCTSNATTLTRYEVYQSERAAGKIPTPGPSGLTTAKERRLAYIAIYDCVSGVAPKGYLKAFMLEPAQGTNVKTGFVEVLGMVTSKTDPGVLIEEVQLYR